jgi:hypothetical protein
MCTYLIVELLGIWKINGIASYLEFQGIPLEYLGALVEYLDMAHLCNLYYHYGTCIVCTVTPRTVITRGLFKGQIETLHR